MTVSRFKRKSTADNPFGGLAFYGIVLSPAPREVRVDVKSYVSGTGIDFMSVGSLRVAILGDGGLDALQVNPASARFGPGGALPVRYESLDYNRDGYTDGEGLAGSDFVHGYNCQKWAHCSATGTVAKTATRARYALRRNPWRDSLRGQSGSGNGSLLD